MSKDLKEKRGESFAYPMGKEKRLCKGSEVGCTVPGPGKEACVSRKE